MQQKLYQGCFTGSVRFSKALADLRVPPDQNFIYFRKVLLLSKLHVEAPRTHDQRPVSLREILDPPLAEGPSGDPEIW